MSLGVDLDGSWELNPGKGVRVLRALSSVPLKRCDYYYHIVR